jgi:mono/diheme cytochrome c family protein
MSMTPSLKRKILRCLAIVLVLGIAGGWFGWYKFFREEPEAIWANETEHFKYGSIGAEATRGIPYYIWLVLPRVFPEYLPGPGGYKSFGLVWEEGHEMPVGFTKKVIGFPRVGNNCALCHTGTWRSKEDETPHIIAAAPSHTTDVQALLRFLTQCGQDPRFNASTLLSEIDREVKLSAIDRLIYRFALVPLTRNALHEQKNALAWMNRPGWPDWGRGRDDPMNLTKYFMTSMATDNSTGQADFPSVWNLKVRKGDGLYLNWSCDTPAVRSVLIDSALGLGSAPDPKLPFDELNWSLKRRAWFLKRMEDLDNFLSELPPPKYPFTIDGTLAARGKPIYAQQCAACHDVGGRYTNKPVPPAEIGTDRERMDTWIQAAADEANRRVKAMGIDRPAMVKIEGYQSPPLDGIWMRAPYLHNGSVPTLRDLLKPPDERPKVFYRGYDVYDPTDVGFITRGFDTKRYGWKHDTAERGNGNQGHSYGTTLATGDRDALLEYLKTL